MNHYRLVLFALYSVALLQMQMQPTGSLSAEGSGGTPDNGPTYEELMRDALVVQAGGSGAPPLALGDSFCNPYAHDVTLEYEGCVTTFPVLSCTGRCFTEERPNYFYRR